MDAEEREAVIAALQEALQGFYRWVMEEAGEGYFLDTSAYASRTWEEEIAKRVAERADSPRAGVWERDWYAFYDGPRHPSIHSLLDAEDLEITHFAEAVACEHARRMAEEGEVRDALYDESFGVLVASEERGWMYRLDFCEFCGLVEVWSMRYTPEEIALHRPDPPG